VAERGTRSVEAPAQAPGPQPDDAAEGTLAAPAGRRLGVAGERLEGFIYGTIVALTVVVAGARAYPHAAGHVAALVAVTSVVFWLAHVYAHGLGQSVASGRRLHPAELRHIARHELALVEAAVPPVAALVLGALGVLAPSTSYWVALALGLGVLTVQGLRFAQIEHLGTLATLAVVTANVGFGIVLIGLKLLVMH
jgi:hypothetical protein